MQKFIKSGGPGAKLKADFEKLNRDIVIKALVISLTSYLRIYLKQQSKN